MHLTTIRPSRETRPSSRLHSPASSVAKFITRMDQPIHLQLKLARERQGLSLEDVSHSSRIPVTTLQLLEAGNYAGIGSMAYARGFLRSYGQHLGVEAEGAVQALPKPILGGAHDYQYLTKSLGPWVKPSGKKTRSHSPRAAAQVGEVPSGRSVTVKAAALVTLISSGCLAWVIYVGSTESAQNAKKDREERKAAAAESALIRRPLPVEAEGVASAIQIRPAVVAQ